MLQNTDTTPFQIQITVRDYPMFTMYVAGEENALAIYHAAHDLLYKTMSEADAETLQATCEVRNADGEWVPFTKTVGDRVLTADDMMFVPLMEPSIVYVGLPDKVMA